jgi:lysophospholipase L1-like esterase
MKRLNLARKEPLYLGALLIVAGLLLRRLIEWTLVADTRIESPRYLALIFGIQVVVIGVGAVLLIKQPALRVPRSAELALLAASLGLTFVSLEIGARLWLRYLATPDQYDRYVLFTSIQPEDFAFTPHQYLGYYPTPNYTKGLTAHNSLGYRGREVTIEKPRGVYRIVTLGGSSTYDVRIEDNAQTAAAQLERLLREEYGFANVEVINAGVPGYNSWEILANLEFRVLDLDPDLVIIYEGTNDVHARMVDPAAYRGDDSGRRRPWQVPPVAWWEHSALLRIVSRTANLTRQVSVDDFVSAPTYWSWPFEARLEARDLDPAAVLEANPPVYWRRNLNNMIAVAQQNGVEIMLSTWAYSPYMQDYASESYYQQGFQENNDVVRDVANEQGIPLFDFVKVMPQDQH